jgi:hypothetical protein
MTENQNPNRKMIPRSGGFLQDLAGRFRLIGRLMMDSRVSPFLKALPVATLVYVFSPVDLLSLNPLDDAFFIWAGTTLFVELCPPDVVQEHTQALQQIATGQWKDFQRPSKEEIVDGEFFEVDPNTTKRQTPR